MLTTILKAFFLVVTVVGVLLLVGAVAVDNWAAAMLGVMVTWFGLRNYRDTETGV